MKAALLSTLAPGVSFREISPTDLVTLGIWHYFLHEFSWEWRYTKVVRAIDELRKADYLFGSFAEDGEKFVGGACINRMACPDLVDNGQQWLADFVVHPDYRKSVIAYVQYEACMRFAKSKPERIMMSMENQDVRRIMPNLGWTVVRESTNEIGDPTTIIEYVR